ncbi:MAG: AfsR/SARP family transcriptional regulator [Solirubrobacteraceae bacterium]
MLRVSLLGEVALELDGQALAPPASPAARALLGWLALHPGAHSRADLAAQLWPELGEDEARATLTTALSQLEVTLGDGGARQLVATREDVELAGGPGLWVDAREFAALADAGDLGEAAALSRDELLETLDGDWVDDARAAHRARLLGVLEGLAAAAEQGGDLEAAARWTREQTALDPLSEERHRALILRLDAVGDRAGAILAYERLRERLRSDLRIKPSAETRALVERLGHR